MPDINPKEAGDNIYPQYNRITNEPASDIAIVKGRLYTKGDDDNYLSAVGAAGFINGVYQATVSAPAGSEDGEHNVQCLGPGSRVLLPAVANMHGGHLLQYNTTTHRVEKWTGTAGGITPNEFNSIPGRAFAIYTKTSIGTPKNVTEAGDLMEVELGQR